MLTVLRHAPESGHTRRPLALCARTLGMTAGLMTVVGCGGGGGGGGGSGNGGGGGSLNSPPAALADVSPNAGTPPLQVTLDASGSADQDGTIAEYRWSFGDGSADATGVNVQHTFQTVGSFEVVLTVTDDDGGTDTDSVIVQVAEQFPPNAQASASPESGVAPLAVTFDADGSTDPDGVITLYEWDFGDGSNVARGASVDHVFQQAGNYDVTLRVVDDSGLADTANLIIQVDVPANAPPEAEFVVSPDSGSAPLVADFDASGSSDPDGQLVSYQWDFGDGDPATGVAVQHTFDVKGTYEVTLTVTDDGGATDVTTRTVTVGTPPVAAISASPESGTPSLTVEFDGTGSSDSDGTVEVYQWDFDDGNTAPGPTPSHTFEDPGDYQVSLMVTDDDGLTSEPAVFSVAVTRDPASLSFRDFFDTDSVGDYDVTAGAGQSVTYDPSPGRMQVTAGQGTVEVSRSLPAEDRAFFQIRFLPTQAADSPAARFTLRLEEDEMTYYEVWAEESVESGGVSGGIRKVVNGSTVAGGEAEYPDKPPNSTPIGYTDGLAYSVNVFFTPDRLTAEFTELGPRVLSISPQSAPIKVGRFRVLLQDQDAYLDSIIKEPLDPSSLSYYIAFGDSITEGTGDGTLADGRGYPIELQTDFQQAMVTSHVVFNEGFGGLLTAQAVDRIAEVLARHPRAQFVTVMIGTNDALQDTITKETYKGHLEEILRRVRVAGKTPYVAKLPPLERVDADSRIDSYNEGIDELIAELNSDGEPIFVVPPDFACYFAANEDPDNPLINSDGIHPTGLGYQRMAELWLKMIDLGASADAGDACTLP